MVATAAGKSAIAISTVIYPTIDQFTDNKPDYATEHGARPSSSWAPWRFNPVCYVFELGINLQFNVKPKLDFRLQRRRFRWFGRGYAGLIVRSLIKDS
jgi:hypothetical protein